MGLRLHRRCVSRFKLSNLYIHRTRSEAGGCTARYPISHAHRDIRRRLASALQFLLVSISLHVFLFFFLFFFFAFLFLRSRINIHVDARKWAFNRYLQFPRAWPRRPTAGTSDRGAPSENNIHRERKQSAFVCSLSNRKGSSPCWSSTNRWSFSATGKLQALIETLRSNDKSERSFERIINYGFATLPWKRYYRNNKLELFVVGVVHFFFISFAGNFIETFLRARAVVIDRFTRLNDTCDAEHGI